MCDRKLLKLYMKAVMKEVGWEAAVEIKNRWLFTTDEYHELLDTEKELIRDGILGDADVIRHSCAKYEKK